MQNSRFGYSVKENSFKGLNIDCIQYLNIIRITHYSYSDSCTILNPNIIRIRIRPNICAWILFLFVFAHSEKTNIIRIRIQSKILFRILFVFVFGPKNSIRSPLLWRYIWNPNGSFLPEYFLCGLYSILICFLSGYSVWCDVFLVLLFGFCLFVHFALMFDKADIKVQVIVWRCPLRVWSALLSGQTFKLDWRSDYALIYYVRCWTISNR